MKLMQPLSRVAPATPGPMEGVTDLDQTEEKAIGQGAQQSGRGTTAKAPLSPGRARGPKAEDQPNPNHLLFRVPCAREVAPPDLNRPAPKTGLWAFFRDRSADDVPHHGKTPHETCQSSSSPPAWILFLTTQPPGTILPRLFTTAQTWHEMKHNDPDSISQPMRVILWQKLMTELKTRAQKVPQHRVWVSQMEQQGEMP